MALIEGIERIRFTTSHPREFNDRLIEAYARVPKLANHLHLPVQSGSDRILALMKRGHTVAEYREKIRALWNPGAKLFFEGPDDPRLGLLRVTPSEAEYWSSNSTWIGNLIQMAVAKVTGDTSKLGENEKIKL